MTEITLAIMILLAPLSGFFAPINIDGWTTLRDRTLMLVALVLLAFVVSINLPFGIIFALLLLRYRGYKQLHGLIIWTAAFSVFEIVKSLPDTSMVIWALILAGICQAVFAIVDIAVAGWHWIHGRPITFICGSLGNRIYMAAFLTILLPLTDNPIFITMFIIGIIGSRCRGAIPALGAAMLVTYPQFWTYWLGLTIIVGLMIVFSPWISLTSLRNSAVYRLVLWRVTWHYAKRWPGWLIGHGFMSFKPEAMKWISKHGIKEGFHHAHNDWLQFFYEFGFIGYAALTIFLIQLYPNLRFGDPFTGSLTATAILAMGMFPFHIGPLSIIICVILALIARGV